MRYEYIGFDSLVQMHGKELWSYIIHEKTNYIFWKLGLPPKIIAPRKCQLEMKYIDSRDSDIMMMSTIEFSMRFDDQIESSRLIRYEKDPTGYYIHGNINIILGDSEQEVREEAERVLIELITETWEQRKYTMSRIYLSELNEFNSEYVMQLKDKKPEMFV